MSWDVDTASEATGTTVSSDPNVDYALSGLFREIGNTLVDVTKQGISGAVSTVKTNLANKIMNSPEGKAQISQYKMQTVFQYLPYIIIAALVWIVEIGRAHV